LLKESMTQKSRRTIKSNDPADEPGISSSGMGAPPVSRGKKIPALLPHDDLTTERSVERGADDA
jgi:hypothetical protein